MSAMPSDTHFYEPLKGCGLPFDPFNAIIGPRPIGWISSCSVNGTRNLAPYSFFNGFCYAPYIIGFASIGRKDTLANIEANGEFVWNLATRELADAVNKTSAMAPPDIDEFELAGLMPVASTLVGPSRVSESPAAFECKVSDIVRLKTSSGTCVDTWLVLGEVVGVHISRSLLVNGVYDTAAARPILRGGGLGDYYVVTPDARFTMTRPDYP